MEHITNQLEKIRPEQVPQESMRPVNSEDTLMLAVRGPKLFTCSLEELKGVLRYAMVKVGLRAENWPVEEEKNVLIAHIIKNYGNHTTQEVQLAFDMAIVGKLDLEQKEVVCYENFSCLYFSNIMNAYRKWAVQALPQETNPLQIEDKEDTSDAAMLDWLEHTRTQNLSVEFLPVMLYDWLDRKAMITKSNAEKKMYLQRAVAYRHMKLVEAYTESMDKKAFDELKVFNEMKDNSCFEGDEIKILKSLAKKMILYDYLIETTAK